MEKSIIKDNLVIATLDNGKARVICTTTTELVKEASKIHNCSATAGAAFGRMLTAGVLMGSMLKNKQDLLTLKINGGGPLKGILVTSNDECSVKGYVGNSSIELPANKIGKLDIGGAIGANGSLQVIKDLGLKEPYSGQVPLVSGEIGEDFAYYFTVSEQTPSAVALGVLVGTDMCIKVSGGFIVQMLPDSDELFADLLTYRLEEAKPVTTMISEGKDAKGIIQEIFDGIDIKFIGEKTPKYKCDCSVEKVERALISIGKKDLEQIYTEGKDEKIVCHFCNNNYVINNKRIGQLLQESI